MLYLFKLIPIKTFIFLLYFFCFISFAKTAYSASLEEMMLNKATINLQKEQKEQTINKVIIPHAEVKVTLVNESKFYKDESKKEIKIGIETREEIEIKKDNNLKNENKKNIENKEIKDINANTNVERTKDIDINTDINVGINADADVNVEKDVEKIKDINTDINADTDIGIKKDVDADVNVEKDIEKDVEKTKDINTDINTDINADADIGIKKDVEKINNIDIETITIQNISKINKNLEYLAKRMANSPIFARVRISPALLMDAIDNQTHDKSLDTHALDKILQDYIFNNTSLKMLPPSNYNYNFIAKTSIKNAPKSNKNSKQYIICIELYDESNNLKGYWSEKTSSQ